MELTGRDGVDRNEMETDKGGGWTGTLTSQGNRWEEDVRKGFVLCSWLYSAEENVAIIRTINEVSLGESERGGRERVKAAGD